ncbi:MAG: hypothetical protein ACXABD_00960 [Candidatus Thorarchaeota archaeon]|jgi:hypothetical protein
MATYIQNEDNYFPALENTEKECFLYYIKLNNDYIREFNEKISYQNPGKHAFVLEKGLETICHVFMQFLVYSNNLEFTIDVTEKAYQYYIEFIGQIGEETNAIFNLSSQDAILFAYKKTIYEIPLKVKKEFVSADPLIFMVKGYTEIYNNLLSYHLNTFHCIDNLDVFLPITDSLTQLPLLFENLDTILSFNKFIQTKNIQSIKYLQTVNLFIKQMLKKPIKIETIEKKYLTLQLDAVLENSASKIVRWFSN